MASLGLLIIASLPSIMIWPLSGVKAPDRIFIKVDLPAPLSPINPTTSPSFTLSETEFKAVTPPNFFVVFFKRIT